MFPYIYSRIAYTYSFLQIDTHGHVVKDATDGRGLPLYLCIIVYNNTRIPNPHRTSRRTTTFSPTGLIGDWD